MSIPNKMVFYPLNPKTEAILIETYVFPHHQRKKLPTELYSLLPSLYKNLRLALTPLNASETEDFGFSKTLKLFS